MKTNLTYYITAGQHLDALVSAFSKFEEELTWFQKNMDDGDFEYEEAAEAVDQNYYDIRNLTNKISEQLKDAEDNLIQADKDYTEYIKKKLAGVENPRMALLPWFRGFKGTVRYNEEIQSNEVVGCIERLNTTNYVVTELPIGIEYQKYVEFLDKLIDNGTIVDYEDKCDPKTENILFEIKTTRAFTKQYEDLESLNRVFHLVKTLPENLNCIDETGRIHE